jgi:hypothetical protein
MSATLLFLELNNQLEHNLHPEGFSGQMPEHELHGGRHRCLERGNLVNHLSMVEGNDPHSL